MHLKNGDDKDISTGNCWCTHRAPLPLTGSRSQKDKRRQKIAKSVKGLGLSSFSFMTILAEISTGYEEGSTFFFSLGFALFF